MGDPTSRPLEIGMAPAAARRRRPPRRVVVVVAAAVTLVTVAHLAGGWYMSSQLGEAALDAAALRASFARHDFTIPVLWVSPSADAITLEVVAGRRDLLTEGVWGIRGAGGGFGQVGRIRAAETDTVTRDYRQLSGPPLVAGELVEWVGDSFPPDPAVLGLDYQNVSFPGPLGDYPAWFIPGVSADWAILVHGKALARQDTMELLAPIHRAGLPMLVSTYRNASGAPRDSSGVFKYGVIEWRDLEAAVRYALGHGARSVVLAGRSAGGAVVASFLERSPLASSVKAVILDAPMLDFSATVDCAASRTSVLGVPVPPTVRIIGKWMAALRYGFKWSDMDYLSGDSRLAAPVLLFQGTADGTVPQATSDRLAKDRPDLVTYVLTKGADHLDSWNVDPPRYEHFVEAFLRARGA